MHTYSHQSTYRQAAWCARQTELTDSTTCKQGWHAAWNAVEVELHSTARIDSPTREAVRTLPWWREACNARRSVIAKKLTLTVTDPMKPMSKASQYHLHQSHKSTTDKASNPLVYKEKWINPAAITMPLTNCPWHLTRRHTAFLKVTLQNEFLFKTGNNSIFWIFSMASLPYWPGAIFTLTIRNKTKQQRYVYAREDQNNSLEPDFHLE